MLKVKKDFEMMDIGTQTGDDRTIKFKASTDSVDRDGDIIKQDGWNFDSFMKNPVILWNHRDDMPPIGKATNIEVKDNAMYMDIKFADAEQYEFADTIYKLAKGGFVNAVSVSFLPVDFEVSKNGDGYIFNKQDLIETSVVSIPANPEATMEFDGKSLDAKEQLIFNKYYKSKSRKMIEMVSRVESLEKDLIESTLELKRVSTELALRDIADKLKSIT